MNTQIRGRINDILAEKGALQAVMVYSIGLSRGYNWAQDSVAMALRAMERDRIVILAGSCYSIRPFKPNSRLNAISKKSTNPRLSPTQRRKMIDKLEKSDPPKEEPKVTQSMRDAVDTLTERPMPDNIDRSLSELEQRLTARQIDNMEQKLKVLRKLAELLQDDIGEVLMDVVEDLEGVGSV